MADFRRPEDLSRIESEAGIIATLIHHPDFAYHSEFLMPEHFTDKQNQIIYSALKGMAEDGISTIDTYGIQEYLKQHDSERADLISKESIDELINYSSILSRNSARDYKVLVSNVWDVAFRREMLAKLNECKSILLEPEQEDVRKRIYEIVDSVMTSYSYGDDMEMYTEKVDALWEEIVSRQKSGYSGIPFKFPALNDYVTMERGELIIFAAQQKVGKSIMLLNCAVDLLKNGYSVMYIDSELSDRLFTARLISHVTGIEYKRVTAGAYSEEENDLITRARQWLKSKPFQHVYMPFFDAESIYTTVKQYNHRVPVDVLVIDYFKSNGNEIGAFETYAAMGRCVDMVKNGLAGDMNIAAIGAAQATQYNRLADSSKIARNASTVIMLLDKTKDEIQADGVECGNKKMIVTMNRNGMQHADGEYIDLLFDGNHISYKQAKQHIPQTPF